jgi:hypothetical protein
MRDTLHASVDGISLEGFSEPVSVGILRETRCSGVPQHSGIYLVLRMSDCPPKFLVKSTGGAFKKKDPTCSADFVFENWIEGAHVVYIGKAAGREGLRRRLDDLIAFGYGEAVGHWGGRLLWHLPGKDELLVRWRICPMDEADKAETKAIANFKSVYGGRRPYANLAK